MVTLFITLRSPFARRIRILLQELNLKYEEKIIDVWNLKNHENQNEVLEFLNANPLGRVPVLKINDKNISISDSNQIQNYLYRLNPHHEVFQTGAFSLEEAHQISAYGLGLIEQTVNYYLESIKINAKKDFEFLEELKNSIDKTLIFLNNFKNFSPYLEGKTLRFFDIDLGVALGYILFRIDQNYLNKFSNLLNYYQELLKRSSFKNTVPKI
jgi:glutathione S-transferase